ncbi:MAG: 3-deoxy-8-phosphooctulonate synthase [Desulfonatronovibrionaceae bacterium]
MNQIFERSLKDLFFIAGPCVLESRETALRAADELARIAVELDLFLVFKSSFDKANRTSVDSFRGPGLEAGLKWLLEVKERFQLPVITDVHHPRQAAAAAEVADVLQIPAFLCRQTDLLLAAAKTGRVVNVKKGQFLAPWDMEQVARKLSTSGNNDIWLTERGTAFGYNNLVVDFRSIKIMHDLGYPVVFDATHSVQLPGGRGLSSGGNREHVPLLARSAVAAGCQGVFMEVHPDPDKALCDGPNSWPLSGARELMISLMRIRRAVYEGE